MNSSEPKNSAPDLRAGVPLSQIPEGGMLTGTVGDSKVLVARLADGYYAVGAECTHYGGPLGEGLLVGDEVRCPWHHACFNVRTGAARKAPAFDPLGAWRVELKGDKLFVREQLPDPKAAEQVQIAEVEPVVVIGAGAAGFAAALRLRELGYDGAITMLGLDDEPPYDRPNLSKDYLMGDFDEDWLPLRDAQFYASEKIDLHTGCEVAEIDVDARLVRTADGREFEYGRLLITTGAVPRPVPIPGFDRENVVMLRSWDDSRKVIELAEGAGKVGLLGAGFIGMETAAALRSRGLEVTVVELAEVPLERVVGEELGRFLVRMHESKGIVFHLGAKVTEFDGEAMVLDDGTRIEVDLVLAGIGVVPESSLAEKAGLAVDRGIIVDDRLRTSVPEIYAAGDVARYPWQGPGGPPSETARVEHWVHAERMGQTAAANILGADAPYDEVPFFWTQQFDMSLRYCGHGTGWEEVKIDGDLDGLDFTARYYRAGELIAAASVGRDLENLQIEEELRQLGKQ